MIHLFDKQTIMFPVKWANSVVAWITGVCSPSGTIKIQNTTDPKGPSMRIDVDIDAIFDRMKERLDREYLSKDGIKDVIDTKSIICDGGIIMVNPTYIRDIAQGL